MWYCVVLCGIVLLCYWIIVVQCCSVMLCSRMLAVSVDDVDAAEIAMMMKFFFEICSHLFEVEVEICTCKVAQSSEGGGIIHSLKC